MNTTSGFIVLHRKIVDWEWYHDSNTFCLFLHLLLTANYEEGRFEGRVVKRGQLVTSLSSLSKLTGLSIRQTRTALNHLVSTGEVTNESCSQYRVITIVNYGLYQDKRQSKRQTIDKQPTNDATSDRQQYNNNNNINNNNNKTSIGGFTPPTLTEVTEYFKEIGSQVDPGKFYDHYVSCGWILKGGQKMKDWQATARNWDRREKNGEQRPGTGNPGVYKKNDGTSRPDYSFLRDSVIQV